MQTHNAFYAIPKERLANLLHHPSTIDGNGDLRIRYAQGPRRGEIVLSDYLMPDLLGPRARQMQPYVLIGTRVQVCAPSRLDVIIIRALLERVARHLAI